MPWQRVDFTDNAAVLELLEAKHVGVFALLDEESRLQARNSCAIRGAILGAIL